MRCFITAVYFLGQPHPSPSFFRLASNAFPDIGLVGRNEKNWNLKKKNHKIELSEEEALVPLDEVKS